MKGSMKKKIIKEEAQELIQERTKEIHRVTTKESDGTPLVMVMLSDPDQFTVAIERTVKDGPNKGAKVLGDRKYYSNIEGALFGMMHYLSKAEAKDLKTYADSIRKYKDEFRALLSAIGMNNSSPF